MHFPGDDNRSRPLTLRGYVRHPGVRERTDQESQFWRERHGVQVSSVHGSSRRGQFQKPTLAPGNLC